jgi:hypothetical protein
LETANAWFDTVKSSASALPPAQAKEAWQEFSDRVQQYCNLGSELRQHLQHAIALSDLTQEPADNSADLAFFDVASGRSAECITRGYERRLAARLQQVQRSAVEVTQQWQGLRDELMRLLDLLDSTVGMPVGQPSVVNGLEAQLRKVRFQEIPVEADNTLFDPSLHEAIAGERPSRPELPENTIVQLVRRGFFYEGKVLRRALVTLSSRGQ